MRKFLEILIGLIITVLAGEVAVGRLVDRSTEKIPRSGVPDQLKDVVELANTTGGAWIGRVELILFFAAFWFKEPLMIGGWLAFKVASTWATWQHLIRVPVSLPDVSPLDYLKARKVWGSLTLTRYLVGTGVNIIVGLLGFVAGKNSAAIYDMIKAWFS